MARVINFGSLNVDHVYAVDRFVAPGETIRCRAYQRFPGGKGLNQSIALARAGATVAHAGCVGPDGQWLRERLTRESVDTAAVRTVEAPTGHAVIQVADSGENAIVICAGANGAVDPDWAIGVVEQFGPEDVLLIQNEINALPEILTTARRRGLWTAFNPAPMTESVMGLPLDAVDLFILNESEAATLTGTSEPDGVRDWMGAHCAGASTVLTLGGRGACYLDAHGCRRQPAVRVQAKDTTAAGDTFTGYFLHTLNTTGDPGVALARAARAAALCITRDGAADSIPAAREVEGMEG